MTCVLGMVVMREREIRSFNKTPFYRVPAVFSLGDKKINAEWKAVEGSRYFNSPLLYNEKGFKKKEDADGENHLREIPSSISFKDRNFYKQWISVFLAGRMAEEMFTNHVTSGASDDLSRATGIARDMVCEYALSNISNVNTFGMGENGVPYSQKTLEKIDVEVENILEEARKYCKLK